MNKKIFRLMTDQPNHRKKRSFFSIRSYNDDPFIPICQMLHNRQVFSHFSLLTLTADEHIS
jgi:hypothetical protein